MNQLVKISTNWAYIQTPSTKTVDVVLSADLLKTLRLRKLSLAQDHTICTLSSEANTEMIV